VQLCISAATGSRDSPPGTAVLSQSGLNVATTTEALSKSITLGHSREPPAAHRQNCHLAKRLPSRALGYPTSISDSKPFEDEDDLQRQRSSLIDRRQEMFPVPDVMGVADEVCNR
jgi:hypothetical protein